MRSRSEHLSRDKSSATLVSFSLATFQTQHFLVNIFKLALVWKPVLGQVLPERDPMKSLACPK